MIPKKIMELAKIGGWTPPRHYRESDWATVAFKPEFWKSLGLEDADDFEQMDGSAMEEMGAKIIKKGLPNPEKPGEMIKDFMVYPQNILAGVPKWFFMNDTWQFGAHTFLHLVLEGKDTDYFWEDVEKTVLRLATETIKRAKEEGLIDDGDEEAS